ncbi:MAG: FAD-dependent oxidoreductase [Candidatus Saccharicenans sp.]|jgi:nitrite reductase (NADH) large subunit|nr:FAD-dependent oxidoreductase [Candidatus Saccharicenans sp.]MDH7493103.1 FAD-dependent oxidoreductase [Candidatus Saccharicenans sp.]
MRVVILGNGLAGTISGKTIRELDSAAEVIICGEEKYPYYPRPNLIDFLAGQIPLEKVFAFAEGWAERQRLQIELGVRAVAIDPSGPVVKFEDGRKLAADYLVLATGACPFTPPLPGLDKSGLFTIRTLDDVLELLEVIKSGPEVVILGGGLLGLELARALKLRGVDQLSVIEVFSRLLPRQLDETGAGLLQASLEKTGIRFFIGREAVEILGDGRVSGVRLKDGQILPAGVVIIAAGVKPRLDLARAAGLPCGRGVVVDDYLRTGQERIYAAGDVAEHRGRVYGLIPAAFDQARTLAYNLCGQSKKYEGTIPASTLKVVGIYLTSIGLVAPEDKGYEVLADYKPELGLYRKLVLKNEAVVGAIWLGTKKGAQEISRLIQSGKKIGEFKSQILEDNFDFSRLFQES